MNSIDYIFLEEEYLTPALLEPAEISEFLNKRYILSVSSAGSV